MLYLVSTGFGAPNGYTAISATLTFTHQVSYPGAAFNDLQYWVWLGSTKQPLWMCSAARPMTGGSVVLAIES